MSVNRESNTLLDTVNKKISELISDFQNKKLSREQFNLIYARYNRQLNLALNVQSNSNDSSQSDRLSTNAFKNETMNKATGGGIYLDSSNVLLETLGVYTLTSDTIMPILEDFNYTQSPKIVSLDEQWLVLVAGNMTTIVLQYTNPPNERYFASLERLMLDFENVNQQFLADAQDWSHEFAQPFVCAVKSLKR